MKNHKRLYIGLGLAVLASYLLLLGSGFFEPPVTSYASCVKNGGKIQETFPEVCVKGKQSFVNPDSVAKSGTINGTVRLFPSQPVCQTGQSCSTPAKGLKVDLTDDGGNIIAETTTDDSGFYTITAPVGDFNIAVAAQSPGHGSTQRVTVTIGSTQRVDLTYDSGIR